jgi:PPOX class probable F420-dependent enzyme
MEAARKSRHEGEVVSRGSGERPDVLTSELARELLGARLMANLATHSRDGGIHLVPMWFLWDGNAILIPTNHATQKARNLERDSRASVMIDDSREGFDLRGITIMGDVTLVRAPDSFRLNRSIHLKYLTVAERDSTEIDVYLSTDDVTIHLNPTRAFAWDLRKTTSGTAASG